MPRAIRIEYPGAIYHVMSRGNQRHNIFRVESDRRLFLVALSQACEKTGWQVHAYCLMGNHFHLVVETPAGNLVSGMKWLLGVYTKRFNIGHKTCGHLFAGRYKALVVDGGGNGYLPTVCDYVHLNPVRAHLIKKGMALESFVWSSYGDYLKAPDQRPGWLRVDRLLGEKGIPKDSPAGRRQFARLMEERRAQEGDADYRQIRRGWCFGDEEFRKELLAAGKAAGASHYGMERRERDEEKAHRLIQEELKRLDWKAEDLAKRRKGDKGKVELAGRLRRETTMTLKWIADHLHMGTWTYVSNLLNQKGTKNVNSED
jgi:REP element-mobilizing transposase RayT